jgi:predicted RNase H-like nuclease (RuvC/YqgF family)
MDAIARFNHTPDSLRLSQSETLKAAELQTGFLAQEVEAAAESVGYDFHGVDKPKNENDFYGLRYAEFVVPLVKAVQEQQATIETLNKKVESAEKENAELKARLDRLEKLMNTNK